MFLFYLLFVLLKFSIWDLNLTEQKEGWRARERGGTKARDASDSSSL